MFPYTADNPLEFKKQSFHLYDQNPIFSNFPSPFFDEHELPLNQIFPHSQPSDQINHPPPPPPTKDKAANHPAPPPCHVMPPRRRNLGAAPRKRTGKKDRHSKICTAQGVRDRRMRLSLQIARKFFDLQDMLGYDKASKTIEWLFCKSKEAIKELTKEGKNGYSDGKSESFASECEVLSGIEENSTREEYKGVVGNNAAGSVARGNKRESRERARARARLRTREKMMIKLGCCSFDHQELGGYDAAGDYSPDVGTIEKLLGSSSNCSAPPAAVSCCVDPSSNFMGFLGNWDQLAVTNQVSQTVCRFMVGEN
ncbi:hypothetical protein ACS0TY_009711 [Phlomoides rotata]